MKTPALLIVVDLQKLFAYLILPDGLPEIVERSDFLHDSPTSVPPLGADGRNGCRVIGDRISEILDRYQPDTWGLACPPEMGEEITQCLTEGQRESLATLRVTEVEHVELSNVCQLFANISHSKLRQS